MSQGFDPYYRWFGIPPAQQPPHHYRLLGLEPLEDDADAIRAAAERHMMHLRTFQSGKFAGEAERLLNEISAAQVVLLDARKKSAYDRRLVAALKSKNEVAIASPDAPQPVLVGELLPAEPTANLPATRTATALLPAQWQQRELQRRTLTIAAVIAGSALMIAVVSCGGLALWAASLLLSVDEPPRATASGNLDAGPAPPPPAHVPFTPPAIVPVVPPVLPPVASGGEPLAPGSDGSIDLIPHIDEVRDTVSGNWQIVGSEIVSLPWRFARLQIPVIPPEEYDFEVVATRTVGNEDLVVGMVYQGRSCGAVLDGWNGGASGLTVDNSNIGAILYQQQKLITNGERITVRCTVRDDYLAVTANGKEILRYAGEASWRSILPNWAARDQRYLLLGTMSSTYRIHSLKLTPVRGQAALAEPTPRPAPAAFAADGSIYLDDYPEVGAGVAYGTLGKRGQTGFPYNTFGGAPDPIEVRVGGEPFAHALSTHPESGTPARVTYALDGKFRTLALQAAIMDQTKTIAFGGKLVFTVLGDGQTLWTSTPLTRHGQTQAATIDVAGVRRLELTVACLGPFHCAWAVWLEPKLSP